MVTVVGVIRAVAERLAGAVVLAGCGLVLFTVVGVVLAGAWLVSPTFVRGLFGEEDDGDHQGRPCLQEWECP